MNRDGSIRDAFIRGILNPTTRQRLLENSTLTLEQAHTQARALELAFLNAQRYGECSPTVNAVAVPSQMQDAPLGRTEVTSSVNAATRASCFFCGKSKHPCSVCPALRDKCYKCDKIGHWKNVCRSPQGKSDSSSKQSSTAIVNTCPISPSGVSKVKTTVLVSGNQVCGMLDSGSDLSLIDETKAKGLGLVVHKTLDKVGLASKAHQVNILGKCEADIEILGHSYPNVELSVMADLIVGRDILLQHSSVQFDFGGPKPPLQICVTVANVAPAQLFSNLAENIRPIAVKSRIPTYRR
ncbi:hypothetical protein GE061_001238 [Apolygus lucorum]|uniref:CCHC-type domain-containing protein n=1 Tax=Apolygus lucorum TaxID=248454 RepID=A0A8S9Y975_APOLU|nr:hypothetical protein GE061_001238 [Apolygus lucorum]